MLKIQRDGSTESILNEMLQTVITHSLVAENNEYCSRETPRVGS